MKDDTQIVHLYLDENDQKPSDRGDLRPNGFTREFPDIHTAFSLTHSLQMIFLQRCDKEQGQNSLKS